MGATRKWEIWVESRELQKVMESWRGSTTPLGIRSFLPHDLREENNLREISHTANPAEIIVPIGTHMGLTVYY